MGKFVITSYTDPDMDGISSMFGYSEYLNKSGKTASHYYKGKPKKEVEIVCNKYRIKLQPTIQIKENDKIILVDTGSLQELSKQVKEENIVQIYDHHKRNLWLDSRPDIYAHIEKIGAAATLIIEKFIIDNIEILK